MGGVLSAIGGFVKKSFKWVALAAAVALVGDVIYHLIKHDDESWLAEVLSDVSSVIGDDAVSGILEVVGGIVQGVGLGWVGAEDSLWDDPWITTIDVGVPRPQQAVSSRAQTDTTTGLTQEDPLSFVYLDVGRWGGSRTDGAPGDWNHKRTFGIVCGRTAVLCEFGAYQPSDAPEGEGDGASKVTQIPLTAGNPRRQPKGTSPGTPSPAEQAEIDLINAFLTALSAPNPNHPDPGRRQDKYVHVRRCLRSRARLPGNWEPTATQINIFIGDMHLPGTNRYADNERPAGYDENNVGAISPDDLAVVRADRTHQDASHFGQAPDMTADFQVPPDQGANAQEHGRYLAGGWDLQQWLHYYKITDAFEEAGDDLMILLQRCKEFNESHPVPAPADGQPTIGSTVKVHQLGDCIDLWIGFHMYCTENSTFSVTFRPDDSTHMTAIDFVETWTGNAFFHCKHSPALRALINYHGDKVFCWGNHDSYFANYEPAFIRGGTSRVPHYQFGLQYFCEHGHRWDSTNQDGKIGGWSLAQVATRWPEIRGVEPGHVPFIRTYGRDGHLNSAGELFYEVQPNALKHPPAEYAHVNPFAIYVMGHTHQGILVEMRCELKYAGE